MQNSEILKLPPGLLRKTNLWIGPPGVVEPNERGTSIVVHHSPIAYTVGPQDVMHTPYEPYQEGSYQCPTCEAMGRQIVEIPYDSTLPMLSGEFEVSPEVPR